MGQSHFPLFIVFLLACVLASTMLFLSNWLGPKRLTPTKSAAFECGNPSSPILLERFNVKFYLVAILFLVFDIEAIFIYPWAVVFRDSVEGRGELRPLLILLDMFVFVAIVLVGLTYAWRKGALDWNIPETPTIDLNANLEQDAASSTRTLQSES